MDGWSETINGKLSENKTPSLPRSSKDLLSTHLHSDEYIICPIKSMELKKCDVKKLLNLHELYNKLTLCDSRKDVLAPLRTQMAEVVTKVW